MFFFKKKAKKEKPQISEPEVVLLKTAMSNYELDITKNVLNDNGINFITRDYGCESAMRIKTGSFLGAIEIYVKKSDFTKAKEIVDLIFTPIGENDENEKDEN